MNCNLKYVEKNYVDEKEHVEKVGKYFRVYISDTQYICVKPCFKQDYYKLIALIRLGYISKV